MDIKRLRINLGMSQEDLAKILGVSLSTVRFWEYGRVRPSQLAREKLQKFLKQKGIDDEELNRWAKIT